MGRIKDKTRYPLDATATLDDFIIGSDFDRDGETRNYSLRSIAKLFGDTNNGASTLQQSYNTSTTPEISTNITNGALTLKRGSVLDTDNILEGQNGAGTTTFSVDGNGLITTSSTVDGRDVATDGIKLDGIEELADVTDTANVEAAGAVLETDTTTALMQFVIDEDDMISDLDTKVPTQQSVKAFVTAQISTSTSQTTLQTTYNTSTSPEITTNTALGALTLKRGSVLDTDNILEGQNGAGTTTFSVDGNGLITTSSTVDGRDVATDGIKLDGIEELADVTDTTNVEAAGAVLETDTTTALMQFVIDEDDMVSDLDTKVPTQQSVKAFVTAQISTSTSQTTLQTTYNTSTSPEITTNATNGALTLKRGSVSDTDNILEGQNGVGTTTFSVDGNGVIIASGTMTATNFILSSDKKLKENIKSIKNDEKINIDWKTFNIKKDKEKRYGVIAQELEINHPEFVRTDKKGLKSVAYIDLLIAKINELENRLEQLEA